MRHSGVKHVQDKDAPGDSKAGQDDPVAAPEAGGLQQRDEHAEGQHCDGDILFHQHAQREEDPERPPPPGKHAVQRHAEQGRQQRDLVEIVEVCCMQGRIDQISQRRQQRDRAGPRRARRVELGEAMPGVEVDGHGAQGQGNRLEDQQHPYVGKQPIQRGDQDQDGFEMVVGPAGFVDESRGEKPPVGQVPHDLVVDAQVVAGP